MSRQISASLMGNDSAIIFNASVNFSLVRNVSSFVFYQDALERANRLLQVYVLFSLAIFGFIGNFLIIVILCRKRLRERCFSNINFLILHLAVSDLLVVAFCLFGDAVWKSTYSWLAGDFMCRFVKYMQMLSLYASTFIIVTISLDRCIAIMNPISRFDQHRIVKVLTLCAWTMAALCSIPQVVIFSVQKAPFAINDILDFYQCVTHGAYTAKWQEPAYVVFTFCIMFAVPLLLIIVNYILIFVRISRESRLGSTTTTTSTRGMSTYLSVKSVIRPLRRNSPQPPVPVPLITSSSTTNGRLSSGDFNSGGHQRELLMRRARTKALCISVLVIAAFIVCWAPYYIVTIYYVIVSKEERDRGGSTTQMFHIIFFFGMSNSVLNPVIYGAFHMARKSQTAWRKWIRRGRPRAGNAISRDQTTVMYSATSRRLSSFDMASPPQRLSPVEKSHHHLNSSSSALLLQRPTTREVTL